MYIQCSCCGATQRFTYNTTKVIQIVKSGWNSYGNALYCPECVRGWDERNKDRQLSGKWNTIRIIDELYSQQKRL